MYKITIRYTSGRFTSLDPVQDYSLEDGWLHVLDKDNDVVLFNLSHVELVTITESSVVPE